MILSILICLLFMQSSSIAACTEKIIGEKKGFIENIFQFLRTRSGIESFGIHTDTRVTIAINT